MNIKIDWLLGFLVCLNISTRGKCLQCWKCISDDCETDPELNIRAVKVNCKDGEQCMKVRYKMFDNVTHYDTVVRTCTNSLCTTPSVDEFFKCVATPKLYMIGGCSLRSCCNDRDLCNSASNEYVTSLIFALWILIVTLNIQCI
ncbi:uncharacterized protein LOC128546897 [Mercenaria mercenaria]|uniref:uncharacterized protein LOC128546897 n=1 Tax=Mercenaria mercenaria TaxID=6596 RepID=UPI00234F8F18|nr:uncharacterized protein LOC128546897 [Mercenaria mercenaria]